ncbi:hypothetical protein OROGR_018047 [Orobanche gracilis]
MARRAPTIATRGVGPLRDLVLVSSVGGTIRKGCPKVRVSYSKRVLVHDVWIRVSDLGLIVTESEIGAGQNLGNAAAVQRRCAVEVSSNLELVLGYGFRSGPTEIRVCVLTGVEMKVHTEIAVRAAVLVDSVGLEMLASGRMKKSRWARVQTGKSVFDRFAIEFE